jgi:dTDP-4-dehydrorhamnose 3,5-epimerase
MKLINVTPLDLNEVLVLEYDVKEDNRGSSFRLFSKKELESVGIYTEFVEEILNRPAKKGTLYGIHFQNNPKAQTKLLFCTKGKGLDFAVDLRSNSKTYKKWVCVELSQQNRKQIYIPAGFGHAFLSLEDDTHVVMRIDNYFDSSLSREIKYDDIDLNINFDILNPILSEKDKKAPTLADSDCNLICL